MLEQGPTVDDEPTPEARSRSEVLGAAGKPVRPYFLRAARLTGLPCPDVSQSPVVPGLATYLDRPWEPDFRITHPAPQGHCGDATAVRAGLRAVQKNLVVKTLQRAVLQLGKVSH